MEKTYEPIKFEQSIYQNWIDKGYFKASVNKDKKPFTIIMPPPNITSKLHMGHAFQQTIQDIIIRRKRMQGYEALWLPGTDHAAIATEAKVVEKLAKEGLTKEMLGREKFSEEIAKWYQEYKGKIIDQFKRMGYSCDWDRLRFTMDENNCRAVRDVFVKLYKKGYIYKGDRIVNWCPHCKTSISDAEVDFQENHSFLWHMKYKIEGTDEYIAFATTRPETMLGDTAIAVNPKDERYKHLVGKKAIVPFVNRAIPIIADHYVEMDFGTGVVKITPAHDPNDFEVGLRHNLERICVLNDDATMNENAGKFAGLDRYEARKLIVEELKEMGLLIKVEPYDNNVGHCDRCHTVIEPMISKQWFVKMEELAKPAIKVVEDGEVEFLEERYKKIYLHWMRNIRDWCISRQLWSGHRIPIFECEDCGELIVENEDPTVCPKCGSKKLKQETDTLDTWFSSALWPISTLGYPDKTPELDYFYPTDVLVTAQEIIQLWVARMIFSGLEYVGRIPFRKVLINGTVKDAHGKKMSKSLGNGVDPVEIIDKYGVDTLRFSLFNGVAVDMDCKFSEKKVELNRNFINKIWNASNFVLSKLENEEVKVIKDVNLGVSDKWILNELNELTKSVNEKFDNYDIGMAASSLYDFFWTKFCDWYIEISKVTINKNKEATLATLNYVLTSLLKMLHPFIPFVTERIYQELPMHDETIMLSKFPEYDKNLNFEADAKLFERIQDVVKQVRNVRAEANVPDNKRCKLYLLTSNETALNYVDVIEKLAMGNNTEIITDEKSVDNAKLCMNEVLKVFVVTMDENDKEREIERLNTELKRVEGEIKRANGMLNNAGFVAKAPKNLIDAEKEKLEKYIALKAEIEKSIREMN